MDTHASSHSHQTNMHAKIPHVLEEVDGENRYLSHLKKSISIYTSSSTFNIFKSTKLIRTSYRNQIPSNDVLLEMNKALRSELWFEDRNAARRKI